MQPWKRLSVVAGAIAVLTALAGAGIACGDSAPDHQGRESARVGALLLDAVHEGDRDTVAALLDRGVDVNTGIRIRGACCVTALHVAAARNHLDITTQLIEAGANVNARIPGGGQSPLHWAAAERALDTAGALLAAGADIEAVDSSRQTPLHMAANRMFAADGVAQRLIGRGANVNATADSGERPLHYAVWWSRDRLAGALLDAEADVDAMNLQGYTALHFAAHRRALDAVEVLIASGATLDPPRRGDAPSPLLLAVRSKHEEIALLLIEHGADVGVGADSGAALLALAEKNALHDLAVRILERDGSLEPGHAAALLPGAVAADAYRIVTRLLEAGGDINVKTDDYPEDSLLHVAAEHGSASVARLLLDLGMNPDARNLDEETPLHSAARSGSHEIVGMLLATGASVDARAENDMTPLHHAARGQEPDAAAALLAHGADASARTLAGWTPLHFALLGADRHDHADSETQLEDKHRLAGNAHRARCGRECKDCARGPHTASPCGTPREFGNRRHHCGRRRGRQRTDAPRWLDTAASGAAMWLRRRSVGRASGCGRRRSCNRRARRPSPNVLVGDGHRGVVQHSGTRVAHGATDGLHFDANRVHHRIWREWLLHRSGRERASHRRTPGLEFLSRRACLSDGMGGPRRRDSTSLDIRYPHPVSVAVP